MTQKIATPGEPVAFYAVPATAVTTHFDANPISLDPGDLLGELFASIFFHRPLNTFARWWLEKGILRAIRSGDRLDVALGLCAAGQDGLQRRLLMRQRNQHLAEALDGVAIDDQISSWQRCLRLAPEVRRFMRTWPTTKKLSAPPADWPTYKKCLWRAACTDLALPESAHGLRRAVEQITGYSRNESGLKLLARFL